MNDVNLNVSSPPHHSCLLRPAHEETAAGKDCLEVLELHIQYYCTAIYCGYQLRYGIALSIHVLTCANSCARNSNAPVLCISAYTKYLIVMKYVHIMHYL